MAVNKLKKITMKYLTAFGLRNVIFLILSLVVSLYGPNGYSQEYGSANEVKAIIDARCSICHGCYDAPCQLKLTAYEGLARGSSKVAVYDASRLQDIKPTRLFVDAESPAEWRMLGFHSVVSSVESNAYNSALMSSFLALKEKFSIASGDRLPEDFPLDIDRELTCPSTTEFEEYSIENPLFGMPYGMAKIPAKEYAVLQRWVEAGYPDYGDFIPITGAVQSIVKKWETFLNGKSEKQKLVSRYIFEHLYLGHLLIKDSGEDYHFRLIRSYDGFGDDPIEIPTVHPNDTMGSKIFYYRLIPIKTTVLDKTHFLYRIDGGKLFHLKKLFLDEPWSISKFPDYSSKYAKNPFMTFQDIPARSRYRFLLEDALYFINNFIKGPVCRGQVALNVLNDRFFVAFLSPDYDLSVADSQYLKKSNSLLGLPRKNVDITDIARIWMGRLKAHQEYLKFRDDAYRLSKITKEGLPFEAIWDGDKNYDNIFTVFRHFDSATAVPGFVGDIPKTAWVIDYPIFERMFYDLVVNFNVYASFYHQVTARIYMDYLRMEGEALFLSFFPDKVREKHLSYWYRGLDAKLKLFWGHSNLLFKAPTRVDFETRSYKKELLKRVRDRNVMKNRSDLEFLTNSKSYEILKILESVTAEDNAWLNMTPEVSFVLIYGSDRNLVEAYSLLRNKAHKNVSFIFGEEARRMPAEDDLTVAPGFLGSYPNFFFLLHENDLNVFVEELMAVDNDREFEIFIERYGIRRTDSRIWPVLDDIHSFKQVRLQQAGLLDMRRYSNL